MESLCDAVKEGKTDTVAYLLKQRIHIDDCYIDDDLPLLYYAAEEGNLDIVKQLLGAGASANKARKNGDTPLHIACKEGRLQIVQLLLSYSADPDKCAIDPPLIEATKKKYTNIVKLLLEAKADVKICKRDGDPALVIATTNDDTDTALELIKYIKKSEGTEKINILNACKIDGDPPLVIATMNNNLKIVEALLEAGAPNTCWRLGDPSLVIATENGYIEIAQKLVNHFKEDQTMTVNSCRRDGSPSLAIAVRKKNLELVRILVAANADVSICYIDRTPALVFAAQMNRFDIVSELLKCVKININEAGIMGNTALFYAAQHGKAEAVQELINMNADVAKSNKKGITPFKIALDNGKFEIVNIIMKYDPSLKEGTNEALVPFIIASREGQLDTVKNTNFHRVDINATFINESALMGAVKKDCPEIVSYLLEQGADFTMTNTDGHTPLHLATKHGCVKVVSILIAKGANVLEENSMGESPLTTAAKCGQCEVVCDLIKMNPEFAHNIKALLGAAEMGQIEIIKQFKEKGGNINAALDGIRPMDMAARNGHLNCVIQLIKLGAEINNHIIQSGITSNNFAVVQELLNAGNNLDTKMQLLKYVAMNNEEEIQKLISTDKSLVNKEYEGLNLTILEIACYQLADTIKWETVKLLLENGADPNKTFRLSDLKSAIHFAAMGQNYTILENLIEKLEINASDEKGKKTLHDCVRILCESRINIRRMYDEKTDIISAAERKNTNSLELLLSLVKILDKPEEQIVRNLNCRLNYKKLKPTIEKNGFQYLTEKNESGFLEWAGNQDNLDTQNNDMSYLQMACQQGLTQVADYLIKRNPNEVGQKNKKHPLIISIQGGKYKIVQLILGVEGVIIPPDAPYEALKLSQKRSSDAKSDDNYEKTCYHVFSYLMSTEFDFNGKDSETEEYLLQYAVKYASADYISEFLQRKASLANRGKNKNLTIKDVDYDILKNHFDSCIKESGSKNEKVITFDYTTLIPKYKYTGHNNLPNDPEGGHEKRKVPCNESDALLHMAHDGKQKPLLQHPLIKCFLEKKWHKLRNLYFINVYVYLLFCGSLWLYIGVNYNDVGNTSIGFWGYILIVTSVIIIIRELIQIISMPMMYIKNCDNYVELALLADIILMLFWSNQRQPEFAIAVILSALELLLLIGKVPGLSTYIIMLRTVSLNFFKFLSFNAILIISFAFSFYTMFRDFPVDKTNISEISENITIYMNSSQINTENINFFSSFPLALFKSLMMVSGEIEASSLNLDKYSVVSHILVISFVFLIAIILVNLLNGLAVSDTQKIKDEAKLIALVSQVEYLQYIESIIFNISGNNKFNIRFLNFLQNRLSKWISINYEMNGEPIKFPDKKPNKSCDIKYIFSKRLSDSVIEGAKCILSERELRKKNVDPVHEEVKTLKHMMDQCISEMKLFRTDLNKAVHEISKK